MRSGRLILQSRQGVVLPSSCFDSVFETIERGDSFWAKQETRKSPTSFLINLSEVCYDDIIIDSLHIIISSK